MNIQQHILQYGKVVDFQKSWFSPELSLNRLDLPTSGYLLFAQNTAQAEQFSLDQKAELYQKYYLARVVGDVRYWLDKNVDRAIRLPIMHHGSLKDRMTCVQQGKGRGR